MPGRRYSPAFTFIADIRSIPVILAHCLVALAVNGSSCHPLATLLTVAKVESPKPCLGLLRELTMIGDSVLVQMAAEADLQLVSCKPLLALWALYQAVSICAGVGILHAAISWAALRATAEPRVGDPPCLARSAVRLAHPPPFLTLIKPSHTAVTCCV